MLIGEVRRIGLERCKKDGEGVMVEGQSTGMHCWEE